MDREVRIAQMQIKLANTQDLRSKQNIELRLHVAKEMLNDIKTTGTQLVAAALKFH